MSFGPEHYVPVLKVKPAEKKALLSVAPRIGGQLTPLMEIVERRDKELDWHVTNTFKELATGLRGYPLSFLDMRELEPAGATAAEAMLARAKADGISSVPVAGVSRSSDTPSILKHSSGRLGVRLTRDEFEAGSIATKVSSFVNSHGLAPSGTDLIVDLGAVDQMITPGVGALASAFVAALPQPMAWKTLTVSAVAFPSSMGVVQTNSYSFIERVDWLGWRDYLYTNRHTLDRLPTFSDGAVQHPTGVEGFDPRVMPMSASIRYTVGDSWLLIKGESTRRTRPSIQFPNLARRLAYGDLQQHFAGASHCEGCRLIKAAADGAPKLASAAAWRRIGTIHHMTCVTQDLANLSWP